MTTRPAESVFDVSEPQGWEVRSKRATSDSSEGPISHIVDHQNVVSVPEDAQPGSQVRWVNTELHSIANTIEELQSRLAEANSRLSTVERVETTEVEIGRLFVEAQRFCEAWSYKIELKIHEVLSAAEAKAQEILVEATEEACEIRRSAQHAAFASTQTVQELQSAIVGFTTVNSELLKELGALNSMLTPADRPQMTEKESSDYSESS